MRLVLLGRSLPWNLLIMETASSLPSCSCELFMASGVRSFFYLSKPMAAFS